MKCNEPRTTCPSREEFAKELFNSLGGCVIKETTGHTIYDRWVCAKFGKDNSGMVLDKKEIRRTINEIQVPYADSQTGRIALTIYIDLIVEAIYSKFSQQPPKERKVSLEEIKIIKGNSY